MLDHRYANLHRFIGWIEANGSLRDGLTHDEATALDDGYPHPAAPPVARRPSNEFAGSRMEVSSDPPTAPLPLGGVAESAPQRPPSAAGTSPSSNRLVWTSSTAPRCTEPALCRCDGETGRRPASRICAAPNSPCASGLGGPAFANPRVSRADRDDDELSEPWRDAVMARSGSVTPSSQRPAMRASVGYADDQRDSSRALTTLGRGAGPAFA
jgi:hypothetical protein